MDRLVRLTDPQWAWIEPLLTPELDVAPMMKHATPEQQDEGKRLLGRVVAMLTRMCR